MTDHTQIRPSRTGDGFTEEEIRRSLTANLAPVWRPQKEYYDYSIRDLRPGSAAITFMGRAVNIYDMPRKSSGATGSKGVLKIRVKDDTGKVTVRVTYNAAPPAVFLGSLLSVWTTSISAGEGSSMTPGSNIDLTVFVSAGKSGDSYLKVHEDADDPAICNTPLGPRAGSTLGGLMTMHNFINGGADVAGARVLVMVKSMGPRKEVTQKSGIITDYVKIHVHDDTGHAVLGLWGPCAHSPHAVNTVDEGPAWQVGKTVLLIQEPSLKVGPQQQVYLTMSACTTIEVNPDIADAEWLREWAVGQKSREAVNASFPEGVFSLDDLKYGPNRCLFTLAELDQYARHMRRNDAPLAGYLSVLVVEMRLYECWQRNRLYSGECCGEPIYSNGVSSVACQNCCSTAPLRVNPHVLGRIVDETGAVGSGAMLLSDKAWTELLGRKPQDLGSLHPESLKYISDRLLFCRISVAFGWSKDANAGLGRICVLEVQSC